jgi:hypothetical protein
MDNLGHQVGRTTVGDILRRHGIEPAPERGERTQGSTFLRAHWGAIAATDFFTVEVLTLHGLVRHYGQRRAQRLHPGRLSHLPRPRAARIDGRPL